MKRSTLVPFLVAFLVIVGALYATAQVATPFRQPVSQVATHDDACTPITAQAAAGSQTTLTISAASNTAAFIYISDIEFDNVVGTALGAAVAPTFVTTTNLGGLKWGVTFPTTANSTYARAYQYPAGLKSAAANTPVTIVGPAGTANLTQTISACYWYGF